MNINNLYGNLGNSPLTNVGSVGAVGTSNAGVSSIPPATGAATASISAPGQFFSELQQLSQQDPAKFKAVAAQLATSFQSAASQASGPQAKMLGGLANQLSQAAQTGTLQPPQTTQAGASGQALQGAQGASGGAETHHHHHHHGGGSTGSGQSTEIQQAFQNAMGILTQAMQTTSSTSSAASPPST
jgi:hypothetical protein